MSKPKVPYHYAMPIVAELVNLLYSIDGCECAGLAHVVIDDNNISNEDLTFTISYCDKPENVDRKEQHLVKCIMKYLLEMSIQQRFLMWKFIDDMRDYVSEVMYMDEQMWEQWWTENENRINETLIPEMEEYCKRADYVSFIRRMSNED